MASVAVQISATAEAAMAVHDSTAGSEVVERLEQQVVALQNKLKVPTRELVSPDL